MSRRPALIDFEVGADPDPWEDPEAAQDAEDDPEGERQTGVPFSDALTCPKGHPAAVGVPWVRRDSLCGYLTTAACVEPGCGWRRAL